MKLPKTMAGRHRPMDRMVQSAAVPNRSCEQLTASMPKRKDAALAEAARETRIMLSADDASQKGYSLRAADSLSAKCQLLDVFGRSSPRHSCLGNCCSDSFRHDLQAAATGGTWYRVVTGDRHCAFNGCRLRLAARASVGGAVRYDSGVSYENPQRLKR